MIKFFVTCVSLVLILSSCQATQDDINNTLPTTQVNWTPFPSPTPFPTYTPPPTYTPYPTHTVFPSAIPSDAPPSSEMVTIPAGEFLIGCDPWDSRAPCLDGESPSHYVYLDVYAIDLMEVKNSQYALCVEAGVCRPPNFGNFDLQQAKYENPAFGEYPITNIDWYDARDYCTWVGKRLPSEAEWEKAARGDLDERFYPWGDAIPDCSLVNFMGLNGDCPGTTTPVDDFHAGTSPYGVFNLAGNVGEWVADWYDANYYLAEPSDNPQGPDQGFERVIRSGSYNSDWIGIRVNWRGHNPPYFRSGDLGFRCARDS